MTTRQARVRISVRDGRGQLESALSEFSQGARKASATRNLATREGKALRIELAQGSDLAVVPLLSRGEVLGLLEVIASPEAISTGWKALKSVADQGALSLRTLEEAATHEKQSQSERTLARLAQSLVRARSTTRAVEKVAVVCSEMFDTPVIAWAVDVDLTRLALLGCYGLTSAACDRVRAEMRTIRRPSPTGPYPPSQVLDSLKELSNIRAATLIEAGDALIVIGGRSPEITAAVRFIKPMLRDVLRRLGVLALADLHHERLDLGISWTAHELRGPLNGTRAVIDLLLQTADEESRTQHLLKRSREDLDRLAALVDSALRVTMTDEAPAQQPTPLMRVIQDAINMCRSERSNADIVITNGVDVVVQADPAHLTGALANVFRNSLWHSPTASPVEVDVVPRAHSVQVRVTDQGPRVSGADKEMIFDPFGRGESPRAVGRGKGLGLFIARRVIESHGGTIKVGSSSSGAMFLIELPLAHERRQASAS